VGGAGTTSCSVGWAEDFVIQTQMGEELRGGDCNCMDDGYIGSLGFPDLDSKLRSGCTRSKREKGWGWGRKNRKKNKIISKTG